MPGVSGDKMAEHVKAVDVNHIMGKPFTVKELRNALYQSLHS
jgi:hypothetical protein